MKKGSYYAGISFFVPQKIKQTVTYKDSDGNVIDSLTHTQYGLTGQSYTTGLPSGPKYVRRGEYLDNITNNGSGLMSEFYDGYSCTKDYHDGVKVTFTENDSEGIGAMDYVIYDDGWVAKGGSLAYGQSTNYTKYIYKYIDGYPIRYTIRHTIVNPYVPQTTNIVYQYKKLGQVITTDPSGNKTRVYYTVYYTNDQSDPIKSEPVNAKPITGYSAIVKYENKIVSDKNFMPTNLGENTYITYVADAQKATINYIDDTAGKTLHSETVNGHTGEAIADPKEAIANYKKQGYQLASDDLAKGASFDNDDKTDQAFYIHLNHNIETITPDNPKTPSDIIPGTTKHYPSGVDKESLTKTITRTINYVDNKGNKVNGSPDGKSTYVQTVTFTRTVTIDKVTGDIKSSTPWVPANGTWSQVNSRDPHELGYDSVDISTVGSKVVTSSSKDETITVTYSKDGGAPTPTPEPNPDPNPQPQPSDPRNVPAPSTPTSQPTNNKKDDENKDNNSNPKKRRNPNKTTVKTGSTRNNHPKINNNTSAKVANGKTSKAAKTLPQTGENNKFGLIGLLFAALGVVFGLAGDRKRKN